MHNLIYLLLQRMRMPLIVIVLAYAISILGLVLMPGVDDKGNPWHISLFHAFYFVSFMGSTIGFGEIPYPFTDPQRLWTTVAMYMTVISWLYAIGALLALLQDPAFRRIFAFTMFTRAARRMREPFYLVCGLGEAGTTVIRELVEHGVRCIALDHNETRIQSLRLENFPMHVPAITADVTDASALRAAGLEKPECAGVIALTNNDHVNLTVAITSKLLAPNATVMCRAESHDAEANMDSFGTDYIINPFDTFAERFAMLFHSPSMYLVYEWMTSIHEAPLSEFASPPRGIWVLCGYGRFGKAVKKSLSYLGVRTVIVESDLVGTSAPESAIQGRGTEAITLHEAGIEQANGIIAGTDDDANNLSIIITALDQNPELFTVARQNLQANDAIFNAADIDLTMQPDRLIARRIVDLITTPLLPDFLRIASNQSEDWANVLVSRVAGILTDKPPEAWTLSITREQTPALIEAFDKGMTITLAHLLTDPRDNTQNLPCVALYIKHPNNDEQLVPDGEIELQAGDQLLFCGRSNAETHMRWTVRNFHALDFTATGIDRPSGTLWRLLSKQLSRRPS